MDSFQQLVLGISIIILILVLIGVGMMMRMETSVLVYPPIIQPCPDGWNSDSSGNCYFVGKNGGKAILPNGTMNNSVAISQQYPLYQATYENGQLDFSSGNYSFGVSSNPPLNESITNTVVFNTNDPAWAYQGGTNLCAQQKFANQYSIYWDGVSNTNQCSNS